MGQGPGSCPKELNEMYWQEVLLGDVDNGFQAVDECGVFFDSELAVGQIFGLGDVLVKEPHFLLHEGEDILDFPLYYSGNNLVRRCVDVSIENNAVKYIELDLSEVFYIQKTLYPIYEGCTEKLCKYSKYYGNGRVVYVSISPIE